MQAQKKPDKIQDFEIYTEAESNDYSTTVIAVFATIAFHAFLLLVLPSEFYPANRAAVESLELEILPPITEEIKAEDAPKMLNFVEANPLGNDDISPDKNAADSFKNQRLADEITDDKSDSKLPFVAGEMEDSNKIVSGTLEEMSLAQQAMKVLDVLDRPLNHPAQISEFPDGMQQQSSQAQAASMYVPASGNAEHENTKENSAEKSTTDAGEKSAGKDATSASPELDKEGDMQFAEGKEKSSEFLQAESSEKSEIKKEEQVAQEERPEAVLQEIQNLPKPKARPSLSMRAIPGPLVENKTHASYQGTVSIDSKFSEFGAYQLRMLEAISRQWNLLGNQYDLSPAINSFVTIEFSVNMRGELVKIAIPFTNSTKIGAALCEQAITSTAPFGAWTEDMVDSLGNSDQIVRINFHYR